MVSEKQTNLQFDQSPDQSQKQSGFVGEFNKM